MPFDLTRFPDSSGVYLMKDASNKVLYVGKAKSLQKRIKQYFIPGRDERLMVPHLVSQVHTIDTIVVFDEKEALLLENTLIKKHKPKFNILLKDDKTFISLMINHKNPWPMIRLVRLKEIPKENGLHFGPYTSALAAREIYELMTRLFKLRQCSDKELASRTRPCLLYSIKRCLAPCVAKCTKEEYHHEVERAIQFLRGQNKEVLKSLHAEMEKASNAMDYERAGSLLKTIRRIEEILAKDSSVIKPGLKDTDVLGFVRQQNQALIALLFFRGGKLTGSDHFFFSDVIQEDEELIESFLLQHYQFLQKNLKEILLPFPLTHSSVLEEILSHSLKTSLSLTSPKKGEKKELIELAEKNAASLFAQEKDHLALKEKLLLDLQETLGLNRYPKRIECFDTSNISGSDLVASMITFTEGERDKKRTRLFRIRHVFKADDYGALREVLRRRLSKAKEEDDLPDLIVIDGGKGQLNVALDVFKELDIANVDVISLVKENARHDKGMTREKIFLPFRNSPLELDVKSPLLFLLQHLRDEAHRSAITFHRKSRAKRTITSTLDTLPGIGPTKKKRLLQHFGSVKKVKEASVEELRSIKGLTQKDIDLLRRDS